MNFAKKYRRYSFEKIKGFKGQKSLQRYGVGSQRAYSNYRVIQGVYNGYQGITKGFN